MKTKILFFNNRFPSEQYPKVAAYAKTLTEMLMQMGFQVDLCVNYASFSKLKAYVSFYIRLCLVRLRNYQVLYINHYTSLIPLIIRLILRKNLRTIFHWHGEELINDSLFFRAIRFCMKYSFSENSYHISPSVYYKKVIRDKLGVPDSRIFVSPSGGVDLRFFPLEVHDNQQFHIGFPAALTEHKGVRLLYDLLEQKDKLEERIGKLIHFHLIRYGDEMEKMEYLVKAKYSDFVTIHDMYMHKDIHKFYAQTHITLFLSKRESLGLTVLESMASGVPVIARNHTSMPELVIPKVTGELVSKEPTTEEILNAIQRIHANLLQYKTRDFVEKKYSFEQVQKEMKDFITGIL